MKFTDDGTGRALRPIQEDVINWMNETYNPKRHLVVQAGVGSGKSVLGRTFQRATGAVIVTAQNSLVSQYKDTYPELNKVIGGSNFKCGEYLTNCLVGKNRYNCKGSVDVGCCYQKSLDSFTAGVDSICNIMSAWVTSTRLKKRINSVVWDEAHTAPQMLRQMTSSTIKFTPTDRAILRKLGWEKSDLTSEIKLVKFFEEKIGRLSKMIEKETDEEQLGKLFQARDNTVYTKAGFEDNPELYSLSFDDGSLRVLPVKTPRVFLDKLLGDNGLLMSATLVPHDLEEIFGNRPYDFYDAGTPIPASRRQVHWTPSKCGFSYDKIDPEIIAADIKRIYEQSGKEPTIVHATYSMAVKLQAFLFGPDVIFHCKEDKAEALERFKKEGGLLIASGMAEGVSLDYDLCRQQIIIQLSYPNLSDLYVKKRRALADGEAWYLGETYKIWAQQIGRSTRAVDDWSRIFILDSRFKYAYREWCSMGLVPKYIRASVKGV